MGGRYTPRTDAEAQRTMRAVGILVPASFARELEHELSRAVERLEAMEREMVSARQRFVEQEQRLSMRKEDDA